MYRANYPTVGQNAADVGDVQSIYGYMDCCTPPRFRGNCGASKQRRRRKFKVLPNPPFQLPLLITGLAGVPGYNAYLHFQKRLGSGLVAIRPRNNWRLQGDGVLACNIEDQQAMDALWERYQFGSVLSFGGSCRLKACELDPAMADRVNVSGTKNIVRNAVRYGARMVHLSSDLVFAGRDQGGYRETDIADPVTVYGKTMVQAEQEVLGSDPLACVLRISLPMGPSFGGHAGAIDWIESRFSKQRPATLYFDEIRTPTYVDCMNRLYERLLSTPLAGLYHAGGVRCLSLYQIGQIINRVGGYAPNHLHGCARADAGPVPPRAGNVSMDSGLLTKALGGPLFQPWPHDERLVPTGQYWHYDRPTQHKQPLQSTAGCGQAGNVDSPSFTEGSPPDIVRWLM